MIIIKAKRIFKRIIHISIIIFILILILIILFLIIINKNASETIGVLSQARIKSLAAKAMNDAVLESMADDETYASLIEFKDNGQKVYMLQANTRSMNILAADCAELAQEKIKDLGEQGISVPIGTISGITFLAGRGPSIKAYFTPAGSVKSEFTSEFVSAGINQTLHRVKIRLTASVNVVLPNYSEIVKVSTEASIAESIIVGDVPQSYTNVANEDDMLNFIPSD